LWHIDEDEDDHRDRQHEPRQAQDVGDVAHGTHYFLTLAERADGPGGPMRAYGSV
jgi:hypothetical protein